MRQSAVLASCMVPVLSSISPLGRPSLISTSWPSLAACGVCVGGRWGWGCVER